MSTIIPYAFWVVLFVAAMGFTSVLQRRRLRDEPDRVDVLSIASSAPQAAASEGSGQSCPGVELSMSQLG
jgi:hypothetical protein